MAGGIHYYVDVNRQDKAIRKPEHVLLLADWPARFCLVLDTQMDTLLYEMEETRAHGSSQCLVAAEED